MLASATTQVFADLEGEYDFGVPARL